MAGGDSSPFGKPLVVLVGAGAFATVAAFMFHQPEREPEPRNSTGPAPFEPVALPDPRPERPRPEVQMPVVNESDLRALAPRTQEELDELSDTAFRQGGGVASAGTDPQSARSEVNDPGWAEAMAAELREGLERRVVCHGAEIDRVDCAQGRCLVELKFDSMYTALTRAPHVQEWLTEQVRCRAYTDGPEEVDTPSALPGQQIWILCGSPSQ